MGLNQQFELNVEVAGSDANSAPQPPLPDLDAFASYVGSSTSTSMQIVNGQMTVTKTYTHHYIATREGKFQIPQINFSYKGKSYSSQTTNIDRPKIRVTRKSL